MSLRKLSPRTPGAYQRSSSLANINVVLLGALGVGKSALTVKFMTRRFIMEYDPFIEDTYSKRDTVDGQDVQINVMDTYDKDVIDIEKNCRWCDVTFVVFSITNQQSFVRAREYLDAASAVHRTTNKDIPIVLVGNKLDLEQCREVTQTEACSLAGEYDCLYYEISAAEDYDEIIHLFHDAVRLTLHGKDHLMANDGAASVPRRCNQLPQKRAKSPKASSVGMTVTTVVHNNNNNGSNGGGNENSSTTNDKPSSMHQRKPSPTFKIFNKSFKIFN